MTITEFLLARIEEDEAYARDIPGRSAFVPMPADAEIVVAYPGSYDRMLAEAEAKRMIVELHDDGLKEQIERRDGSALGAGLMHDDVIRALASVYAAHPDYQAEWQA
jgi:hypothetical protein